MSLPPEFQQPFTFAERHNGPAPKDVKAMLGELGIGSTDELIDKTVPAPIRQKSELKLDPAMSENQVLDHLDRLAKENKVFKSYIGLGYYGCLTPTVIQRNILENPGWYTQYTPYQAEISQGRLEALLNFQTMVSDLTGMEMANASLLDEGTAAAEAMAMAFNIKSARESKAFFVSDKCFPQTIDVVKTRAESLGIKIIVGDAQKIDFSEPLFGALVQYPDGDGQLHNWKGLADSLHNENAMLVVAADILSLSLLKPPGEFGADIVVGSTQRFGVPMGYGGPHAAYFATKMAYKRQMPGRLVGVSIDSAGNPALRLALQTREQHIRRAKATSNICTAQVLLAVMAGMYAVYHGPKGIKKIGARVHAFAKAFEKGVNKLGFQTKSENFFDTVHIVLGKMSLKDLLAQARANHLNLRVIDDKNVTVSVDETTEVADLINLWRTFSLGEKLPFDPQSIVTEEDLAIDKEFHRTSEYLTHPVFSSHHSETELLRYINRLQAKDLSLTHSMIPLGSCTMKLNATTEMVPVTWQGFSNIHPFAPTEQTRGYQEMFSHLEELLGEITGFEAISLQPNAGSQGEYAGLLTIRKYHQDRGEGHRNICLIPNSAHGTNPASAVMAGLKVVGIECDESGNISLDDLAQKIEKHKDAVAALMITYPSTHGVFEETIIEICEMIHQAGGQVYLDGANLNAQVGICRPGDYGADVCHLNLHKTFCIPHGGGGPGMGPIGVKKHLQPYLPGSVFVEISGKESVGSVSAAPWGSASILPISYSYILMMGAQGLKQTAELSILGANYIAKKLEPHYPVLFKGKNQMVAHECIIDLRHFKDSANITVEDVAKRLMDYGFHAPTMSWPVAGTMMIEPTESESKEELDRFIDAMVSIRKEIAAIEKGEMSKEDNPLINAPHTAEALASDKWEHPYTRQQAVFPADWVKRGKFWPAVGRINNPHGDKNLVCACPPMDEYAD